VAAATTAATTEVSRTKIGAAWQAAPIESALIEAVDRVAQNENLVVSVKERGWMIR
jgi:hypothetical protein